jgi:hypothetical protein
VESEISYIAFLISEAVSIFVDLVDVILGSLSDFSTFSEIFSIFLRALSAAVEPVLESSELDVDDFFEDFLEIPSVAFSIALTAALA